MLCEGNKGRHDMTCLVTFTAFHHLTSLITDVLLLPWLSFPFDMVWHTLSEKVKKQNAREAHDANMNAAKVVNVTGFTRGFPTLLLPNLARE